MRLTRRSFIKTGLIWTPTMFSAGLHGSVRYGNMDPQVADWMKRVVAAGGNWTALSIVANDAFMKIVRANGLRSTLQWVNTYTGLNLTSLKAQLINDLGATSDVFTNFVAGDYSESTGLTGDGTTKSLATSFNPSTNFASASSTHYGVYIRTNSAIANCVTMGSITSGSPGVVGYLYIRDASNVLSCSMWNDAAGCVSTGTDSTGWWQITRQSSSSLKLFRNGASVQTSAGAAGTPPNVGVSVHCWNDSLLGNAQFTPRTLGGYSIGTGHTDAQMLAYYSAWQRLSTILGRQV